MVNVNRLAHIREESLNGDLFILSVFLSLSIKIRVVECFKYNAYHLALSSENWLLITVTVE